MRILKNLTSYRSRCRTEGKYRKPNIWLSEYRKNLLKIGAILFSNWKITKVLIKIVRYLKKWVLKNLTTYRSRCRTEGKFRKPNIWLSDYRKNLLKIGAILFSNWKITKVLIKIVRYLKKWVLKNLTTYRSRCRTEGKFRKPNIWLSKYRKNGGNPL